MMQSNELRIGNWYDHSGSYRQVTPNTIEEVWEDERIYVNPIPLTPEILEKCGFVNDKKNEWYQKFDLHFRIEYIEYLGEENFFLQGYRYSHRKIEYVHQLQNLYFALTGEELKIEL